MENFQNLQAFLLLVGSSVLLPIIQEVLRKWIPAKLRLLVALLLAVATGTFWTYISGGSWEYFIANPIIILTTAQTVYLKIIKPVREKQEAVDNEVDNHPLLDDNFNK